MLLWFAFHPGGVLAEGMPANSHQANNETGQFRANPAGNNQQQEKNGHISPLPNTTPLVGIIVDDLGHLRMAGLRALRLPGDLSFSFLPNAPYARELAEVARELGKEILLHIPMESRGGHNLGPGGLTKEMTRAELTESVCASIKTIPYARGLSNHMGSLLTSRKRPMRWLMEAMLACGPKNGNGLYFVDTQTTGATVAAATAREYKIPTLERDIFLDHKPDPDAILAGFRQLVQKAKKRGTALGIAHPYPETLTILKRVLPQLEDRGVTLVPVSTLLAKRTQGRKQSD
ncbi:MAG: hypothetical protein BECKG1743D_GA0114223_107243 [Candidatus Kentron sp. G]|nr:MAG: hypothetical protein BECKG1743F_GA0114225_108542 [Candidatus Kentron sp. G]VFN05479.1 MAG: hypothetical protein BECKG1743D_GA0114223_107243 [Candidatus Kentron sp. G]VFN05751.1 MAG: hypothetical protein BECKG1743E_GA0114224_109113 [Candidatus Kentron sp. G]